MVSEFLTGETPSTKTARIALEAVVAERTALVVVTRDEELAVNSLRNLPTVHLLWADQLNTYDVLVNDDVVFTSAALEAFLGAGADTEEEK